MECLYIDMVRYMFAESALMVIENALVMKTKYGQKYTIAYVT